MPVVDLPLADLDQERRERADAARNRARILDAATVLVGERGIENVSMDDVARAACVGAGTLYRRFGDRAGLALALLDEHTRDFQDALISGPPPLGPGAPATERLCAFGERYVGFLEEHGDLLFAAASSAGPSGNGAPVALYTTHVAILLREAAPQLDAPYTARALMAVLAPGEHLFARRRLEWDLDRLRQGWRGLVGAVCGAG
jgi:AcrR family transcriptional regulator